MLQKCGINGIAFDTKLGKEVEVAKAKLKTDGVVDKATGDLVAEWIKSGYRKPWPNHVLGHDDA